MTRNFPVSVLAVKGDLADSKTWERWQLNAVLVEAPSFDEAKRVGLKVAAKMYPGWQVKVYTGGSLEIAWGNY
jgi:hypothetical protein